MTELLKLRKAIKRKKPFFKRQESQIKRLAVKWRSPKGGQSKLRKAKKSHGHKPSSGYSSPKAVRGLNKEGIKEILVQKLDDLTNIEKDAGIIIAKTVGLKKKIILLKKIKELKLKILNIKDIDAYIAKGEEKIKINKKEREQRMIRKEKSKKEAEKAAKKNAKTERTEEEKEEAEKAAKKKVLESKSAASQTGGQ